MNTLSAISHHAFGPATPARISLAALAFLVLLLLFTWPGGVSAQTLPRTPYEHRALYLYNFAKFTEWPASAFADPQSPFILGILGHDPFGDNLDIIRNKTIRKRKIQFKYFSTIEEMDVCHLLFISTSDEDNLPRILESLSARQILTVTEVDHTQPAQGMINLLEDKKVLAFEIDQAAAERAGLKFDTQLVRLAKSVRNRKEALTP